MLIKFQFFSWN